MTSSTTVGIIANPASARDIRRLVAHGGAVTTHDKLNRLRCALAGLGSVGVERVISMADRAGITAGLQRLADRPSGAGWPTIEFVDQPITQSASDTAMATRAMVDAGVGAIIVLGGDGTNRIVAAASGDVPLVSISTGTNNAFPRPIEPTVAGVAAGLVATDPSVRAAATSRAKHLRVEHGDRVEHALVDVAVIDSDGIGSGAVWDPTSIAELWLAFAEPDAIGLSAIGAHVQPVSRDAPAGLHIQFGAPATRTVHPPIAPGLLTPISVRSAHELDMGETTIAHSDTGVIAIDGERMFRFGAGDRPAITLRDDGPVVVDVARALDHAARDGRLSSGSDTAAPLDRSTNPPLPKEDPRDGTESSRALHRDGPHSAIRIADLAGVSR